MLALAFWQVARPEPAPRTAAPATGPGLTKAIEDIQVGERVRAWNPELDEAAHSLPDPDPQSWRYLKLEMNRPGGERSSIELLRPLAWIQEHRAEAGRTIPLRMPEMGLDDEAAVVAVGPCPAIRPGRGRVVTGRFVHAAWRSILDVFVAGEAEPIGCTENHPFWSEDRRAFVCARELRAGERLRTESGLTRPVIEVRPRATAVVVYNLEVDVEHVFQVSDQGVLVHNASPVFDQRLNGGRGGWRDDGTGKIIPAPRPQPMVGRRAQPGIGENGQPIPNGREAEWTNGVPGTRNPETTIYGRRYGGHAIDQMQNRGIPPSAVENAIQHGLPRSDPIPGRIRHYDPANGITVITENGDVVTVVWGQR